MVHLREGMQALVLGIATDAQNYTGKPKDARAPLTRWLRDYRRAHPEAKANEATRKRLAADPCITCTGRGTDYILQWVGDPDDDSDAIVGAQVKWSSIVGNWTRYAP